MTPAFWFWLFMAIWLIWGLILGYRGYAPTAPFYWGAGWNLLLFLILVMVGIVLFPNPFVTLVR